MSNLEIYLDMLWRKRWEAIARNDMETWTDLVKLIDEAEEHRA